MTFANLCVTLGNPHALSKATVPNFLTLTGAFSKGQNVWGHFDDSFNLVIPHVCDTQHA